ncbi:calcium-dependent protein kinase [Methanoculleus sp.]|jgi:hypothetical protein|uniref:calcium-dependent protein kinase n=1 Tax=Methanoculleus sp. TaxID=90427 RepID=UPI0025D93A17|nr:calcium-dependent protein kinase [Methanoculleus sp.]
MNAKIGVLACVALAIAVGCLYVMDSDPISVSLPRTTSADDATYSLAAELPQVKESYLVYRVNPIQITEEQVKEIASRFDLSGTPRVSNKDTGEVLVVDTSKQPEEQISVYAHSGAVVYHILDKEFPNEVTQQPKLPSDTEAEKIALEFLKKTQMESPDAQIVSVGVNQKQEVWEAGATEPKVSYDVTKAVRFGRTLDGLPVYGDEFAVILADGGEAVGLVKTWREVVPDGSVSIKSPEQAYADLIAAKTVRPSVAAEFDCIVIEEVSLGYWTEPRSVMQEAVWPIYVFSGTATHNNIEEPYIAYVFANELAER